MGSVAPASEPPGNDNPQRDVMEGIASDDAWATTWNSLSKIEKLPAELIEEIFSYLSVQDLSRVSRTSHAFAQHAANDRLWAKLVNSYLPKPIQDPGIFPSFRRLYLAHLSLWFIPQHKIWFSDSRRTGNLILARYDNRRGVIEGYRLTAKRGARKFEVWESNPEVLIQSFNPTVSLWLDDPVILHRDDNPSSPTSARQKQWMPEQQMILPSTYISVTNAVQLCQKASPRREDYTSTEWHELVWPPLTIPSKNRTERGLPDREPAVPACFADASEHTFRSRRWTAYGNGLQLLNTEGPATYGTVDESWYTPARDKPYQGIWVGDYSAHGCEFLLFMQWQCGRLRAQQEVKTEEDDGEKFIHKGSLVAVKLTGDENVPRGAISFKVNDIGPGGLVRVDTKEPFENARVVRCQAQVAGLGFRDATWMSSELILISPDCVAHYWEGLGHISYYRRVDIDSLLQI